MKTVSVYTSKGYREYINHWISAQDSVRGILSQMCKAMNCQNAHLTRVLSEKVHLTMDQAFRICEFLKLNRAESSYFMKLTEHDRAGDPLYRRRLKDEMQEIKRSQENLALRFQAEQLGNFEKEMTYYSSWHWIAIHYITEISKYQNSRAIADRLGLSELFVIQSLEMLEKFRLVQKKGDNWILNSDSIHLPKSSPLNSVQHGNWRQRAVLKSQDLSDDGLHFNVVQTLSHEDFEKLKVLLLKTIDDYRKVANPSPPEELICFSCDFFRV